MWWKILLIIIGVIGAGMGIFMAWDSANRKEAKALTFSELDFSNLQDGTYIGEFIGTTSHIRDTKVELVVEGGNVQSMTILKGAIPVENKAVAFKNGITINDLFQSVLEQKRLDVDVISGATVTSKTHLKALEQALLQAQK
nr:FMN-binding protein [uncultured Sphaerochaeta sp.]